MSRRRMITGTAALAAVGGAAWAVRRSVLARLEHFTLLPSFTATPALLPHDAATERRTLGVGRNASPGDNVEAALSRLGGLARFVGDDDVVIVKVSAQWWNQGMTNVAAVRRLVELVAARPGFKGEIIVFENTHFRLADGSGLSRAWVRPSERNVDVPGWDKLGDLIPHFAKTGAPVSFVGLVDGGRSELSGDHWHDPGHASGTYGGDGRGPIAAGDARDGYHWALDRPFRRQKSRVSWAETPLSWPRFTSPRSGLVIDLRDGVFVREGGQLKKTDRKLTWISMTTVNEHASTGMTACCKSAMGVVDMSAGRLGTDPRASRFRSVHYFGMPEASWRMAGPLAEFARSVRTPDLYLAVAEWVAVTPKGGLPGERDARLEAASAHHARTVVAGTDGVAIDAWCTRNLLFPIDGENKGDFDLSREDAKTTKFLRYYREVLGSGTIDEGLIGV
jgi:hypothetical protein